MIAALFVETGGSYFGLPDIDPWDEIRDARKYAGPYPVVAHPPCQRWGKMWFGSPAVVAKTGVRKIKGDDGGCFESALEAVRKYGGVIEHPWGSHAWNHFGMNVPPRRGGWIAADAFGGYTCCVEQGRYGHYARKPTLLYAVGCELPELDWGIGESRLDPELIERIGLAKAKKLGEVCSKGGGVDSSPRIGTPKQFRDLLVSIARSAENKVLDTTSAPQYNNHTIAKENQMSKCSVCSEPQFKSLLGMNCPNSHLNAPAQEGVTLAGTATHDNAMLARVNVGEDMEPGQTKPVVEASAPVIPVDKLVKIYVKIRDAKAEKKKAYEKEAAELDEQMAMVATELKARAQAEGVDGFKTEFGTVYLSETMKTSCADWSAFGEFLKTHDPLEFMEKRISSTAVKEYMKHNEGQLPPGVSVFREIEARVRRAGEK